MSLSVCLLFDRRTDRALRGLWGRLESIGVSTLLTHTHEKHLPHLSYAVLRNWEIDRVVEAVASLPAGDPIPLHFDTVGHFHRGRAALIVAPRADLLARQQRVVDALTSTGADLHHYYLPGRWVPHTSLATHVKAAQLAAMTSLAHDVLPLDATAVGASIIDSGTGLRHDLAMIP
ncbi:2'-5' RNA ligase family protein [Acidipropionibacterium acidipropionici]|uniref:2'-5' RNA ligase n=1 Tax=Acidipropionibacterium acidipropionici TaxID=1748 RepID=A0AAC9ANW5_9ACTN|nr:2'-5' RNA ligase family protein [Acidipropionibacterium acidipropionici]AMS06220.1 2'-5' RNA ligase [Acidipropionibacterium acidipropionici]AOZ47676.1 2'-5' RNA ligase [Acidipropionibacterium acidipropionici]AZP38989.1 2'-5' RNA ligase family protein [Acidipropionibacterium acidipropionici]